ncbi:TPA: hypothetical protein ACGW7B_002257 [Bacillus nitratireducens]|uniref:hypothetical protein n=1 Tax=Bacillus cereus group TaxID=86661 RepID=UPI000BF061E8|nr:MULTISPECIES: hypothetical protein [Bacillus cereus group]PEI76313.1 hypothetical protein CN905_17260 [Bacillus wiedmannii]PEO97631.1 hypothetical protein CN577_30950 [Bacillus toyonensis]PFF30664.1 hypothetical protein CN327_22830 [Bacillus cereus]
MDSFKLKRQVEKYQKEAWELAEKCDTNLMNLKDRIYESGLVVEENKCLMKLAQDKTDEAMSEYLAILKAMKVFYQRTMNKQLSA